VSERVRILLKGVPPVLRGVLSEAAARQPSIELIDGYGPPSAAGGTPGVEIVLAVTADPHQSAAARELMCESQATRVALLTPAGRDLVIYDMASRPISAVDLPTSELLDVVCRGLRPL
jgi:hypothetical protein